MLSSYKRLMRATDLRSGAFLLCLICLLLAGPLDAYGQETAASKIFAEGFDLLKANRPKDAAAKFEAGLKLDSRNALAHFYAGESYLAQNNASRATTHYKQAIQIDPSGSAAKDAKKRLAELDSRVTTKSQSSVEPAKGVTPPIQRPAASQAETKDFILEFFEACAHVDARDDYYAKGSIRLAGNLLEFDVGASTIGRYKGFSQYTMYLNGGLEFSAGGSELIIRCSSADPCIEELFRFKTPGESGWQINPTKRLRRLDVKCQVRGNAERLANALTHLQTFFAPSQRKLPF